MYLYKSLGFLFVGLATLGVFLPLLPTTPLLLVAAGCFARSSPHWHQRLLNSRVFGPIIRDWHERQCISPTTRIISLLSILLIGGTSVFFTGLAPWLQFAGVLLLATGVFFVMRLNVCKK
ncbi:MAG: YbaN family protein [Gammaproteobacteria bacterium]|nr:YbaN family protein [Gammaproteobacteria bacterium]